MLPAPGQLFACPHCNGTKPMLSLISANTLGGEVWSDGKVSYPMFPKRSFIQKCPHCNRFSLLSQWKDTGKFDEYASGSSGTLNYSDAKKAFMELRFSTLYREVAYKIALYFVHAYNDEFRRPRMREALYESIAPRWRKTEKCASPTDDDNNLFLEASQYAIDFSDSTLDGCIIKADLHRERGEWIEAYEILLDLNAGDKQWIVDAILYHVCRRDANLVPLIIDGKKIDYSDKPNFNIITIPEDPEVINERNRNLANFLDTLPSGLGKDIRTDTLGGVYDMSARTFLKLISPSYRNYDVDPVAHIGDYSFYRNEDIVSIKLSQNITTIGTKAFYGCRNLAKIQMYGTDIRSIGDCAFMNCKSLTKIDSLTEVRFLGRRVFAGMDRLQTIQLPLQIEVIPKFTFFECASLTYIDIPPFVRIIEDSAFQHTALHVIDIPESVSVVGKAVFSRCHDLESVTLSPKLTTIPERCFCSCESLREIEIPKNVEVIEKDAFKGTRSLKRLRFRGRIHQLAASAFEDSGLEEIIVPFGSKAYYQDLFPNIKVKVKIF